MLTLEKVPQSNAITKVIYQGNNQDVLKAQKKIKGFESNEWVTFLQAKELNRKVKAGEKGVRLVKFSEEETEGTKQARTFAKSFTVFNLDQTELYGQTN